MSRYEPVRTWTPPERSFFGPCTGKDTCDADRSCPVGVPVVFGRGGDCDCPCHDERRQRLRTSAE